MNGDAGPIALLTRSRPGRSRAAGDEFGWNVLTSQVGTGSSWDHGAFKYPFPLGGEALRRFLLLARGDEEEVTTASIPSPRKSWRGRTANPDRFEIKDLTFLYDDPEMNEYDAQLIAPREKPPILASTVDRTVDYGFFPRAGHLQSRNDKRAGGAATRRRSKVREDRGDDGPPPKVGEMNDISANDFEKRASGLRPVEADGSFLIKIPADTPIAFATLDPLDRGFVVKRTWIYVRPGGDYFTCAGCHEDRVVGGLHPTNPEIRSPPPTRPAASICRARPSR
ncbi:MAG: hypothetical protein U0527_08815 [Candidatus Eisenbacteria bacterium]